VRRLLGRPVGGLGVVLAVVACSAPTATPDPSPVPFDTYAATAQDAYCAWAVRCRHVPDDPTCRRLIDPRAYDTRRASDGIRLGRLAYDPDAAGRCLAGAHAAACAAPPFIDPSCGAVFSGLVPRGGACTTAYDCADHALCLEPACELGCCIGTCGPPRVLATPPDLADVGEPCRSHATCVVTAYCEGGRCRALPTRAGERCQFGCATGDLYCDLGTETCRAHAALGEPCGPEAECSSYVAFCDGICQARPGPGDRCDDVRRCIPSTTCAPDAGACAPRGGEGAPCSRDDECDVACDTQSGSCVAYTACLP
jgi:hypothetical protein